MRGINPVFSFLATALLWLSFGGWAAAEESVVPPPASAYITKLMVSPGDSDLLYAATNGGGLYRSTDGGDFWVDISPQAELRHYHIVVFDPADTSSLYTGGRETGLWQSADGGAAWQLVAWPDVSILSLVIDPTHSDRMYVLTPDGVHRSTTGARGPWTQVFDYPGFVAENDVPWPDPEWPKQFSRFQHLTMDPHQPNTLFLGARWEGGYHRSDDGGETWSHEEIGPIFRRGDRILPDPVTPNLLYAETHHQGMFKSYNNGRSWVASSHGIAPQKRTPHYGAVLVSGSAFDPNDPAVIFAGSDFSNWKSTDAGASWHEVGSSLTCEFSRSFLVTDKAVFAGTNVGIYRSFNGGETWESCNRGLPSRTVIATTAGIVNGQRFEWSLCKGSPAVYRRSPDQGSDWVSVSWLLYESATAIRFETVSEMLVIETANGERQSRDGGLRWDITPTIYEEKPISPSLVSSVDSLDLDQEFQRRVININGAPEIDDSVIEVMYQRPPYVYLAITTPGYPTDGSVPWWTGSLEKDLSGQVRIPRRVMLNDAPMVMRVEVRDFQYGTRIDSIPFTAAGKLEFQVEL